MASSIASTLPKVTLSPPTLLKLYTLCVVVTTASLAIWGPQIISSIGDRLTTSSDSEAQPDEETTEKEKEDTTGNNKWKRKNQIWKYGWEDIEPPEAREKEDKDIVFVAIKRSYGGYSGQEDHLWIEINSWVLTELLRFEFKHNETLLDEDPGLDARELYMARDRLAELAALVPQSEEPQTEDKVDEETPKSSDEDKAPTDDHDKKEISNEKTEETAETEPPKGSIPSDELAPAGPELSKEEYNQALREIKLLHGFIKDEFQKVEERLGKLGAD
ncbi:unnamed protein product, partial [Rhizoctonia solani]